MFIRKKTVWQTLISTIGQEAAARFISRVSYPRDYSNLARFDVGGYIEIDVQLREHGVRIKIRRSPGYHDESTEKLREIATTIVEHAISRASKALLQINDVGWEGP